MTAFLFCLKMPAFTKDIYILTSFDFAVTIKKVGFMVLWIYGFKKVNLY